ncbi:DoxX family protein [Coraliomargarita akajimensis]|uniref:DoxX family protein n=1 Tax=Coraliomargarita akajimensis (strain DSM 45221 / IAM 15411 / JCM 23193 / KCTC 12865 / 04OKA010-24) TaxID=583355 RepID=D5EQG8_CORAD|nr:DoxX family protein [Coraliomargarita akajimensis]ADE55782.1 DoxX family protein [Coraliomargarita akajimensis DSM 45221]
MKLPTKLVQTSNSYAFLPIRLGVGAVMIGHGAQKLFGWFGGHGLEATGNFFAENLGLQPGLLMAVLAGGTEFFGGILLVLGLLTRVSGLALVGTMAVAIVTVHPDAFFLSNNGMEYVLTLLLASLTLVIGGGGALSVDRQLASK